MRPDTKKPLRAGYIKRYLTHGFLPGLQERHSLSLFFCISKIPSTFEKCLHQRLAFARLHCGIRGIRFYEQHHFLFQILLEIGRLSRDSATTVSVMKRNSSMQSSRTLKSQQADITALTRADALNAVRMLVRPLRREPEEFVVVFS